LGWLHLDEHAMQELPQGHEPLQTMQQPVELSWHDAALAARASATPPMMAQRRKAPAS